jgi:drug/metabolite transporter (DMT)-like permease
MPHNTLIGLLAALATALIGSGWQLASRYGVTTHLGPVELAVLRYGVPAIVLLPLLLKVRLRPKGVAIRDLILMVMGGGLPFGLVVLAGVQWAPAAHLGLFMAGSVPLFTTLVGWILNRQPIAGVRLVGLALIVAGIAYFGISNLGSVDGAWRGDLLFMLAGLLWAIYTHAFQRTGLSPWAGVALVNTWSFVLLLPLLAVVGAPKLLTAPWPQLAFQAAGQGVMAGLLGLVTYMIAVQRLGAARASLSAALVPALTVIGGAWLLQEPITSTSLTVLALVTTGVALASGMFWGKRAEQAQR